MKLYHEALVPEVNALPTRSYYIPFTNEDFSLDLSKSKEVTLLDKWYFEFYENFDESLLKNSPKDLYDVPFMWQLKGFDYNQYANFFYPFPFNPPYIDKDNPLGLYETTYNCKDLNKSHTINFEGVDSCLYLFVNDEFVGFSTVSHSSAEFDINPFLKLGENKIKVAVLKWCFGSYFEDQDKLRMSGIFREVYILERPLDHLRDYKITTDYNETKGFIRISLDKPSKVALYDNKNNVLDTKLGQSIEFEINNPLLWNAEEPNLYRLVISYNNEFIEEFIGIRNIEIKNSIFYINGSNVKLRGVNRHSMTTLGYVETSELMIKDLELFKAYNINAVRTSHYPPHPLFTKLCDIYGIYVLEEADLETHGLETIHYYGDPHNTDNFANTKEYEHIYIHRSKRMYERDKNRQCIIMWSMGNEAGWGENFKETSKYLHEVDKRPVHYEGNTTRLEPYTSFRDPEYMDVYSMMYTNVYGCEERIEKGLDKPFMLCEYTHAMGNSCGDIKEYWDYIYKEDRFAGAFVWEWTNHSIKVDDNKYIFGGDFNELGQVSRYEGNFCVDGLVDTNRRVHPSLEEVKEVYAPVDVLYQDDKFRIINRYDFKTLDNLDLLIVEKQDGITINKHSLDIKGIKAHTYKDFYIDIKKEGYKTVDFIFSENNKIVSIKQTILSTDYKLIEKDDIKVPVTKVENKYEVNTSNYSIIINKEGMIESIKNKKELLLKPVKFSLEREPIDNDIPIKDVWADLKINYTRDRARSIIIDDNKLIVKGQIVSDIVEPFYDYDLVYSFYKDYVDITIHALKHDYINNVPRFGLKFILTKDFENAKYFGRGKLESYIDRFQAAPVSLYEDRIDDMCFMYQKTQHSGSHNDSRMFTASNDDTSLIVESNNNFSFQFTRYEVEDVKRHNYEMNPNTNKSVLHIDFKNTGLGSAACGDFLFDKYLVNEKEIDLNIKLTIKSLK